ncbi:MULTISPECIES: hypothetical protein [unclassified Methanosarcina]|uniref:hypothetical protein n=1 Tax=unclassified Methanosarcina TaxID=2644672 RepID=UPI00061543D9|nr:MULTISPECIES: hypothetical protein [unclassified Methanosarcina]AKB19865.1 Type I restriction-modification system, specificity subunit S [Methanosarcina sp. WWM596]AKB22364.1 Type I restriction-modification system, specificity subunit S [Methanosarcina sp. WH1]
MIERIEAEKRQLVKEGKIKKFSPLPVVDTIEIPYEVPTSWEWIRFGKIVESMMNGIYKHAKYYSEDGIGCLRMYNINGGEINLKDLKRMILTEDELKNYQLLSGDLLVNRVNSRELVGKAGVIRDFGEPLVFESKNIRVRLLMKETLHD